MDELETMDELERGGDEAFYKEYMPLLEESLKILSGKMENMRRECAGLLGRSPVDHYKVRLKDASSVEAKLTKLGYPKTARSAFANLHDLIGARAVCGFIDDIRFVQNWLYKQSDITVVEEKDYIKHPKPNGYRSCHIIIRLKNGVPAEIQLRTLAMDCWASMEHQMKYKKENAASELIVGELKRSADEMASVDWNLLAIREMIEQRRNACGVSRGADGGL